MSMIVAPGALTVGLGTWRCRLGVKATVAIGGGRNAGLLAVQILATGDAALRKRLAAYKVRLAADSRAKNRAKFRTMSRTSRVVLKTMNEPPVGRSS